MALDLTQSARRASQAVALQPQLVLELDGVATRFGSGTILKYIQIGDPGLLVDGTWQIGGLDAVPGQSKYISFDQGGTSSQIQQNLNPDKGKGNSVTSLTIGLIDKNGEVANLIAPGQVVTDVLGLNARVYLGFQNTAFPDDYITIFRGFVSDLVAGAGYVSVTIDHPDSKKRAKVFKKASAHLSHKVFILSSITIASPGVATYANHGLQNDQAFSLLTTGALPSPLTTGTTYYARNVTANTFEFALTPGGASINTTGTQSGVHTLYADHNTTDTTLYVSAVTGFLNKITGPDGTIDPNFRTYLQIDDEIIEYTSANVAAGFLGPTFTGCTRGALDTTAAIHDFDTEVTSFYRLQGDAMLCALKLMLSGWNGPFVSGVPIKSINQLTPDLTVPNAVYFRDIDVAELYGVAAGDFASLSGCTNPANDVSSAQILEVVSISGGSYIRFTSAVLVDEASSPGLIAFRSQYDTLPDGIRMSGFEVDVAEHQRVRNLFLSSFDYDFYLPDPIDGKDFIETEIYLPCAAYSVPRKSRSSVGYTTAPIPGSSVPILNQEKIKNPSKLTIRRSIGKNFYNAVLYQYDEQIDGRFRFSTIVAAADSLTRIPVGVRSLDIKSKGLRSGGGGDNLANSAATRRLNRYKLGAEYLEQVELLLKHGFDIEIGDVVLLDSTNLQLANTKTGDRNPFSRLYEVANKTLDIRTGGVKLALIDTNYDLAKRYGLISPASRVRLGASTTQFFIEALVPSKYGADEFRKWDRFTSPVVRVRNSDYSVTGVAAIASLSGNQVTLATALSFVPAAGYVMELAPYTYFTPELKLLYACMRDSAFTDGSAQFLML